MCCSTECEYSVSIPADTLATRGILASASAVSLSPNSSDQPIPTVFSKVILLRSCGSVGGQESNSLVSGIHWPLSAGSLLGAKAVLFAVLVHAQRRLSTRSQLFLIRSAACCTWPESLASITLTALATTSKCGWESAPSPVHQRLHLN